MMQIVEHGLQHGCACFHHECMELILVRGYRWPHWMLRQAEQPSLGSGQHSLGSDRPCLHVRHGHLLRAREDVC